MVEKICVNVMFSLVKLNLSDLLFIVQNSNVHDHNYGNYVEHVNMWDASNKNVAAFDVTTEFFWKLGDDLTCLCIF